MQTHISDSFQIAAETKTSGLIHVRLSYHDFIVGISSPVQATRVDNDRKLVTPGPRQLASKQLLALRRYWNLDAERPGDYTRISTRCDDIDRPGLHLLNFT